MADTIERNPAHPDALTLEDLTDGRRVIFMSTERGAVDSTVYVLTSNVYEFSERNEAPLTNPGEPREDPGPLAVNFSPEEGKGFSTVFVIDIGGMPFSSGKWSDEYLLDAPPQM